MPRRASLEIKEMWGLIQFLKRYQQFFKPREWQNCNSRICSPWTRITLESRSTSPKLLQLDPERKSICYDSLEIKKNPFLCQPWLPALITVPDMPLARLRNRHGMKSENISELRAKAALKLSFTEESEGLEYVGSVWVRIFQTEMCLILVCTLGCWVGAEP